MSTLIAEAPPPEIDGENKKTVIHIRNVPMYLTDQNVRRALEVFWEIVCSLLTPTRVDTRSRTS